MVGRFIENEKICTRQHHFDYGRSCPLAARQGGYLFKDIIALKKKGCKGVSDRRLGKSRDAFPNLFKNGVLLVKAFLGLVVICGFYPYAEGYVALSGILPGYLL